MTEKVDKQQIGHLAVSPIEKSKAAQYKAKSREKKKLSAQEGVQLSPLQQAKAELANNDSVDFTTWQKFKGALNEQDLQKLKDFAHNQNKKHSKLKQNQGSIDSTVQNIQEKAKRLGNQQIPILHQCLLQPFSQNQRKAKIEEKINENLYLFLEYMENYQAPTQDFLSILVELYDSFEKDVAIKIFVRVCAMHQGEELQICQKMVSNAIVFLLESKVDNVAAFGLLRLAFQNSISFASFDIEVLRKFEDQYDQTVLNFFKSLPRLKYQVVESLPPTCFTFTKPMLKALHDGGDVLHRQVPYQFLPYIIEIICYSFEDSEPDLLTFLEKTKEGCKILYEQLLQSGFSCLLQALLSLVKDRKSLFFKSLSHVTNILSKSFELLREKKIDVFDARTISTLVSSDEEQLIIMRNKPKVMKNESKEVQYSILKKIKELNPEMDLNFIDLEQPANDNFGTIFAFMGIKTLHPAQQICLQYCFQATQHPQFIKFDIGYGKTSICLGLAMLYAKQKRKVWIVNKSKDLTFRDFKKANTIKNLIKLKVTLIEEEDFSQIEASDIVYMTLNSFIRYFSVKKLDLSEVICIVDEYDSIFLESCNEFQAIVGAFSAFGRLLAFSGSQLQGHHIVFLQQAINANIVDFSLSLTDKVIPVSLGCQVLTTYNEYKANIAQFCVKQVLKSPVIVIANGKFGQIQAVLQKNELTVACIAGQNAEYIDSSLLLFTQKHLCKYQVFIIDEEQGRGLDFATNQEIENNGGVHVLIGCLPQQALQYQQFIGRTGRIGNRGQYSVILFDNKAINVESAMYVQAKLLQLQNEDILNVNRLTSLLQKPKFQEILNNKLSANNYENIDETPNAKYDQDKIMLEKIEEQGRFVNSEQHKINSLKETKDFGEKQQTIKNLLFWDINSDSHAAFSETNEDEQKVPTILNLKKREADATSDKLQKDISRDQRINNNISVISQENVNDLTKRGLKSKQKEENKKETIRCSSRKPLNVVDQAYFNNYGHKEIHEEMLNDKVRCETYKNAIEASVKGKIVLDVGAGTGFLSVIAAKAGASHVYAVEYSEMAEYAKQFIKDNGCKENITLIKKLMEDVDMLDVPKIDVIISEWMGYFLLFENMLPSVLDARKRFLKEDGLILPSEGRIYIAGVEWVGTKINGVIMQPDKKTFNEAQVLLCNQDRIISVQCLVSDFKLQDCNNPLDNFGTQPFSFQLTRDAKVNAFVGWFDVALTKEFNLSTAPSQPDTHWKQVMFFLETQIQAKAGDWVDGTFKMKTNNHNHRSLRIDLNYKLSSQKTFLKQHFVLEQ